MKIATLLALSLSTLAYADCPLKNMSAEEVKTFTTCMASLAQVKKNLERAGLRIGKETKQSLTTEWRKENDVAGSFSEQEGGAFRKYVIEVKPGGKVLWKEIQNWAAPSDAPTTNGLRTLSENDFYVEPAILADRAKKVRAMICGG